MLLDRTIDQGHRSYLSAVEHRELSVLLCRPPAEFLRIDERWIAR
jgi:hypothetical protein